MASATRRCSKAAQLFEAKNPGVKIKAEYSGFQGLSGAAVDADRRVINEGLTSCRSTGLAGEERGTGFRPAHGRCGGQAGRVQRLRPRADHHQRLQPNALPVGFTARIFYWNKAVLDKAGVPMPKTWDDLFTAGKAFRAKVGDKDYLLDGNLYDLILVSHAYVRIRSTARRGSTPGPVRSR